MNRSDWSADDWEEWLENNTGQVVLIIGEEFRIHTFEYDEGQLTFLVDGVRGYDYDGSRAALEAFAEEEGPYKIVPKEDEVQEREDLSEGRYETAEEWADNM